jgi:glycosyltransferase involved in cell wall biosynthesis
MKIAFIGQKGIPTRSGGIERYVEELSTRFSAQGHQVYVYVRGRYVKYSYNHYKGVTLIHLPSIFTKHLDAISHTFFATVHAFFSSYDIIHYQAIGPSSLCWLARLCKPHTLIVSTFHCRDYHHIKWGRFARWYLRVSEWITCHVPHKTIVVSKQLQSYVKKEYKKNTTLIYGGASSRYTSSTRALKKLGLIRGNYILLVSRLVQHKKIHQVIEAFKRLEDAKKISGSMKLVIVGEGSYNDTYEQRLRGMSKNRASIVFTGQKGKQSLQELFSHAYLFVQPSISEGLSLSLLEAMGYGLAPLVSNIPENKEAIGQAGFVFRAGDSKSLEQALRTLLYDKALVSSIGRKAKERVRVQFNWDTSARTLLNLYRASVPKSFLLFRKEPRYEKNSLS